MAEGAIDPGRPTTEAAVSAFLHGRLDGDPAIKVSLGGGHRTLPAEATLERLQPTLGALGITRCANITHLDRLDLPAAYAVRPHARGRAVSPGQGMSLAAAKAAALMASIEAHHAERIAKPLRVGSETDLAADLSLVDPSVLPLLADAGYDASRRMLWLEGRDLLGDRPLWLPYEVVGADEGLPPPPGGGCFQTDRKGLAAGNDVLEAACHGLCEVIERDAATLWALAPAERLAGTRLDLETVDDRDCRALLERLSAAGLDAAAWELTSDIGVATFRCLILDRRRTPAVPGLGSACHPDRATALMRALLEAVRSRLTDLAGCCDDLKTGTLAERAEQAAAEIAAGSAQRRFTEAPNSRQETFAQDLGHLLDRLQAAGLGQVALVVLSPPGAAYAVVRLVVPGLEGAADAAGYSPGPRARGLEAQPDPAPSQVRSRRLRFRKPPAEGEAGA